jgi:hypothetical protein
MVFGTIDVGSIPAGRTISIIQEPAEWSQKSRYFYQANA